MMNTIKLKIILITLVSLILMNCDVALITYLRNNNDFPLEVFVEHYGGALQKDQNVEVKYIDRILSEQEIKQYPDLPQRIKCTRYSEKELGFIVPAFSTVIVEPVYVGNPIRSITIKSKNFEHKIYFYGDNMNVDDFITQGVVKEITHLLYLVDL